MTTFLSKEVITVDAPDPKDISANFTYSYYTQDESILDSEGLVPPARFVTVSYSKVNSGDRKWAEDELIKLIRKGKFSLSLVQPEYEISTPGMTQITVEDVDLGRRLQDLVMNELSRLFPRVDISTAEMSQSDLANALNNATSEQISGEIIQDLVSDFSGDGITFYDRNDKEIKNELYVDASSIKFDIQFSDKFIGDAFNLISSNPLTADSTNASINAEEFLSLQDKFRRTTSAAISPDDYVPNVTYFDRVAVKSHEMPVAGTCGYIIDKYAIDTTGKRVFKDSFFRPGIDNNTFIDKKVVYGETYTYEARVLSMIQMTVGGDSLEDPQPGSSAASKIYRLKFLVKSRASRQIKVKCIDNFPPPPPDLVTFRYDYENDRLAIKWKFPHTKQRDIKKFQIFKRTSIFNPFTLVAQFDFTDAFAPVRDIEYIDPAINFKFPTGRTIFFDEAFDKSGDAIYSIVSVDAHNLTSNYSDQIRVTFNRSKNIIETMTISPSGAPKQYPNLFISTTMAQNIETVRYTEDVIKDSGHLKMRIYFDPETLEVLDKGKPCHFLTRADTSTNAKIPYVGSYKFQVLNVDRQKMNIVDVGIEDRRFFKSPERKKSFLVNNVVAPASNKSLTPK